MRLLKYLVRNITVLNILLTAAIAAGVLYVISPLLHVTVSVTPPTATKTETPKEESPVPAQAPSPLDYTIIAEQNLFHSERKIPVDKPVAAPLPKPEFVLYGTLTTDNVSIAYMEDKKSPQTTPGRGKRQTPVRKGENISGFTVKEIEADKVVMVRGEETVIVPLNDPQSAKTREASAAPASPAPGTPQPAVRQPVQPQFAPQQHTQQPAPAPAPPSPPAEAGKQPLTQEQQDSAKKTFLNMFKGGRKR